MVPIGIFWSVIFTETLPFRIIVMIDLATLPVVVTFYTEMVIALEGQFGATVTRLQKSLGECYACRDTTAVHLSHSH